GEVDDLVLALVKHVELHRIAGRETADGAGEFTGILDRLAVHRRDHVAGFDTGLRRRAVGLRFCNQCALRLLEPEAVGDVSRDRLNLDTDPAAADRALVLELRNHILHGRCRNRKRDADAAARRRIDRGVDAHHFAFGIEGRATGVALVHGRIDLDEIVVRAVADVAAAGGDDAGRDGAAEAERITDREHPVADPGLAVRKLGEREVRAAFDLNQCYVSPRVGADHLRGIGLAVVSRDFDLVGAIVLGDLLVDFDLHRNQQRLHALDDVGKADGLLYFTDFVVDLRLRGAAEDINRAMRWAKAVNGDTEAGNDRGHQRKFACREQRTAGLLKGRKGRKIDGTVNHIEVSTA